ncbi:MAG: hypothetical protein NTY32_05480 [Bacteroidia bacterium]|nr:hypothetical protein [Bacteroidia bacterium]
MKIAILYIAIGHYEKFWMEFHRSCEAYFLESLPKKYFVFTDSRNIQPSETISVIPVTDQGWPRNTLNRFDFFDSVTSQLADVNYCFFFNANTQFLKPIHLEEVIPDSIHDYLVNLSFHTFLSKPKALWPYDRNPASTAFMKPEEGVRYYQGGFYGGRTNEFLEMNCALLQNARQDDANGILAQNNDESHLNRYLANRHPLCLSTTYGRPEEWTEPENPSIIFRRKEAVLGFVSIFLQKKKPFIYLLRQLHAKLKRTY